jgi:methionine-rich copper-binding protein CopC
MKTVERASHALTAAALMLALTMLLVPGAPRAHAYLDHADPKVGSTVHSSPGHVRIWFDSQLEPAFCSIVVEAPDGTKVDDGRGSVDPSDHTLLQAAVPQLAPGTYRVVWSVVARDGHRTSGSYEFTVK